MLNRLSVHYASFAELTILGNEYPLINGLQQDVMCIFNGQNSAKSISWILIVGPFTVPYIEARDMRRLILSINPEPSINGLKFKCEVVDTTGQKHHKTITLTVESKLIYS